MIAHNVFRSDSAICHLIHCFYWRVTPDVEGFMQLGMQGHARPLHRLYLAMNDCLCSKDMLGRIMVQDVTGGMAYGALLYVLNHSPGALDNKFK